MAYDPIAAEPPSPFPELLGARLAAWSDGAATVTLAIRAEHLNRSGVVHGGVLLTLLDQAGAYAGLYCEVPGRVRKAVTVDLDCRFTGQARDGVIRAEGRLVTRGSSIFFARTEIFGPDGALLAFGASTHRYRSGSERAEGVPRGG
jgi:uncharacterized protein (TIGR00369 family)